MLEFKNGINASKEQYGKGIKFINVLDILRNDFITYENIVGKVDVEAGIAAKNSVGYGDILFQRSSETREEVGTANVYLDKERNATFGGFVIRGKKIGDYDPIFLNKLLKTSKARDSVISKSGGSTRFNVGQEILAAIKLQFPVFEEQKKISTLLLLLDTRLSTQNKIIEALKVYRSTITDKLFHGSTLNHPFRFTDFTDDWQEYSFQELLEVSTKRNSNHSIQTVLSASQMHGMVRRDEIDIDIKFDTKATSTYKIVQPGDYVVHLRSFQGGFAFSKICGICSPAYIILKPKIQLLEYGFLKTYFMSAKFIELLKLVTYGIRDGRSISVDEFLKLKVFIPAKSEQAKIQSFIQAMDKKLNSEERLNQALLQQKQYLLDNLFI